MVAVVAGGPQLCCGIVFLELVASELVSDEKASHTELRRYIFNASEKAWLPHTSAAGKLAAT